MLIALHGISRSGKDETAKILVRKYGFKQIALASAIRSLLLGINPLLEDNDGEVHTMQGLWHDNYKDWDRVKAESRESVELMIRLGQSARDILGEDVWINAAFPNGYDQVLDGHIVISDCRQPNEVEFLYRYGGEIWKIERPELGESRGMDGLLKDVRFEATIVNDGSLADLETIVSNIIEQDIY